jgi:hypothetical protein
MTAKHRTRYVPGVVSRWLDRRRAKAAVIRVGSELRNESAVLANAWSDYLATVGDLNAADDPLTEDMPDVEYLRDRVSMAWAAFDKALRAQSVAGRAGTERRAA